MQLNRGDIIYKKNETTLAVACVLGSTVYTEFYKGRLSNKVSCYGIDDVLRFYRKVEIMRGKDAAGE